jgi:hypothetical protein
MAYSFIVDQTAQTMKAADNPFKTLLIAPLGKTEPQPSPDQGAEEEGSERRRPRSGNEAIRRLTSKELTPHDT